MLEDEWDKAYKKKLDDLNLKISFVDFKLMVVMFYTLMNAICLLVAAVYINALRQDQGGHKPV